MDAGSLGDVGQPVGRRDVPHDQDVEPRAPSEQTAYDKWFDQRSDREAARADRTHGAAGVIPAPLWIVLFLSAVIIFVFMLLFADSAERAFVQAIDDGRRRGRDHLDAAAALVPRQPVPRGRGRAAARRDGADARRSWRRSSAVVGGVDAPVRRGGRRRVADEACGRGTCGTSSSCRRCCSRSRPSRPPGPRYQGAHWRSEQGLAGNRSTAARVEANRAAGVANREIQNDALTFTQWVDAYSTGQTRAGGLLLPPLPPGVPPGGHGVDRDAAARRTRGLR